MRNEPKIMRKEELWPASAEKKKSGKKLKIILDIVFYLALAMVIFSIVSTDKDARASPRYFFGYTCFNVLTTSMQDEIPKGSFVLVKNKDHDRINVGDVITYMRDSSTSVTHKVVEIFENYKDSGLRGFRTKGTKNMNPDPDIVTEAQVVGVVVAHLPVVGAAAAAIASNFYFVIIVFGLIIILTLSLRGIFKKQKGIENHV